ncbi:unnamed protein product, partial [Adineta steineri]
EKDISHDDDGKYSDYNRAPSDVSMKQSRSSLHDSMAEFDDDKRRTYLVKYGENEDTNEDQPNFSTAV